MSNPLDNEPSTGKPAATTITIEEIRAESRRRNSEEAAQGYAWGVVIPKLLAEVDRVMIAKTRSWFFVYEKQHENGDESMPPIDVPIAAFPERELAESYSENTGWEIREQVVTF